MPQMSPSSDTSDSSRRRHATGRPVRSSPVEPTTVVFAILAALLTVFVVGPLLKLLILSRWSGLGDVLRDQELHTAILVTVLTASAATGIALLFGTPLAYLLARREFRGRSVLEAILQLPVLVPHPVAGIALLAFLGRDTLLGATFARLGLEIVNSAAGLVTAMAFVAAPIFVSASQSAFSAVDPRLERVARSLGDSPWSAFRRVTLPLARRGMAAGAVVTWARAVSEFGAIVVVAYHPRVASVLIFDRLTTDGLAGAVPAASLLVLVALVLVLVLAVLNRRAR